MFRNFMYNEVGVTKEDIRLWMKEAAIEEGKKLVRKSFGDFDMNAFIEKELMSDQYYGGAKLRSDIKETLIKIFNARKFIKFKYSMGRIRTF